MITHIIGMSLSSQSSTDTGVVVLEAASNKLIYMDKLFSVNDIGLFFENYNNLKNSIVCVSLPWDNTMLEGKWRVLSKPYQLIHGTNDFPNKDNWTQRFSARGSEILNEVKNKGVNILRYEVYLSRQKLNLYSNYKERSSADCKFLQTVLKNEWGFDELPSNMVPASQLEAIVGAIIGKKFLSGKTEKIFEFKGFDVINVL